MKEERENISPHTFRLGWGGLRAAEEPANREKTNVRFLNFSEV